MQRSAARAAADLQVLDRGALPDDQRVAVAIDRGVDASDVRGALEDLLRRSDSAVAADPRIVDEVPLPALHADRPPGDDARTGIVHGEGAVEDPEAGVVDVLD